MNALQKHIIEVLTQKGYKASWWGKTTDGVKTLDRIYLNDYLVENVKPYIIFKGDASVADQPNFTIALTPYDPARPKQVFIDAINKAKNAYPKVLDHIKEATESFI